MRLLLAALLFCFAAAPSRAQQDPLSTMDPALLASAEAGEPQAALDLGFALVVQWDEANLRAADRWFAAAYVGFMRQGAAANRQAGLAALMLGRVQSGLTNFRGCLDTAAEAERLFGLVSADQGGPSLRAYALEDRAICLQKLSRNEESLPLLDQARAIHENPNAPDPLSAANVLLNMGVGLEGLTRYDEALAAYLASYEAFSQAQGTETFEAGALANNIGWVLRRQEDFVQSQKWFELALGKLEATIGPFTQNTNKVRINLGLVAMDQGHTEEAIVWAMKSMPYIAANRTQTLDDQRWTFELLSRAFTAKDQSERAIFFGKMAVNAQQEIRATNSAKSVSDTAQSQAEWARLYDALANLLIGQGRLSEAQEVLNMAKEEEVFNFLRRDAGESLTQTRAILTDTEKSDEEKLAALTAAPIAAERALREVMARIDAGTATEADEDQAFLLQEALQTAADAFDAEVALFLAAAPPEAQDGLQTRFDAVGAYQSVLQTLDRPAAILQVAALEETTHLFLTLPGLTLHETVAIPRADLARRVFDALQALEEVSPDAPARLQALDEVLFAPVAKALADSGTKVVMLNLDGFLRYVPFAALTDGTRYRVEDFAFVLYTPAVPTQFAAAPRAPKATAGFGVTKGHPGFSPLPGVKAELAAIFGGVLSGETALDAGFDERSLKRTLLGKPSILHIASHFNLMPGQEDASFLLLGDGQHLPLSKIRTTRALRFQGVDLLTLSACQTARGGDGSEIDGFAATAQLNGASAVLASLWPVSDAATPILMRDFYAGLIDGGLDKAEALRRAQVAMLRGEDTATGPARAAEALDNTPAAPQTLSHPYFWSAFVLMGNWL